jgi:hypothetical protein
MLALVTAVFNATGSLTDPASVTHGYRPALATAAGLSALGAATALGIRSTRRSAGPRSAVVSISGDPDQG